MKKSKSMILIFSIFFILLIGLTAISATDNTTTSATTDTQSNDIHTQTDSANTRLDTVSTATTTVKTITNTTQAVTKDNTNVKSNNLKESSTENINTNNIEKTTSTNTYTQKSQTNTKTNTQNNEDESDNQNTITTTNTQNTNIQATGTVNKKENNNNQETTLKTSTIKTAAPTTTYDWYVSIDGQDTGSSTYANPTNLVYAFTNAQTGQSIFIKDGTYNLTSTITINKNLNITGESTTGTILSGQKDTTYVQIMSLSSGSNVNITNITFTQGQSISGGAIYNDQGALTINSSNFINNKASGPNTYGGAIYNDQGTCTVTSSSFINNTAIKIGNGYQYSAYGGAILTSGGVLTVTSSNFLNNIASSEGGAIFNAGSTVTSLDYNWWGQNSTNYQSSPYTLKLTNYNGNKLTKWLYLNMTSTEEKWILNSPATLTTNLTGYYENTTSTTGILTTEESKLLPQNIIVAYTTTSGTITDNTNLKNGISTATFTPTSLGTITVTSSIYTNSTSLTKEIPKSDTVYVNATAIASGNGGSWTSPVITIKEALNIVSDNGKIILAEGTYNVVGDYALTIAQNVNIIGQTQDKVIIDGLKANQIMTISNGYNVNITNITLTNGTLTDNGGAINNQGTLTITNSSLINNTATRQGGAIDNNNGGTLTIINSSFINNKATINGGAIFNDNDAGICTVTNSSFINNTALTIGGAIYNTGNSFTVTNSSFINNTARDGGAIDSGNTLTVIGSSFLNNTATNVGGAIYNYGGSFTIKYNIFLNNTATNNYEINNGGTVTSLDYNWWGQNTTNYQTSLDNTGLIFTNYNGEQLTKWLYLNMTSSTDTWNIGSPVTLTTNLTGYYDSALGTTGILTTKDAEQLPQNITVTYTTTTGTITDNTNLKNGISTATFTPTTKGTNTITSTVYTNSTSLTKEIPKLDIVYVNTTSQGTGTGESWTNAVGTITDALDIVSDNGKIILAEGTYNVVGDYALTIAQNVNITGQTQDKVIIDGLKTNQIMAINNGFTVNITNITFTNGQAKSSDEVYGGAINNQGTLTITNSSFINNTATSTGSNGAAGGAIFSTGTCIITNSSFINNTATTTKSNAGGGAIVSMGTCTIINSSFINNTATTENGAAEGGAIYNDKSTCTIINSSFINNTATGSKTYTSGGAIDSMGTVFVVNTIFVNNTVTGFGGAISNLALDTLIVNNSTFINNIALYGGAIYNGETYVTKVNGSQFINNTAIYNGGAIFNEGSLTLNYNIFLNNTDSKYTIYNNKNVWTIDSLDYNWWGQNTTNYQNSPYTLELTNYNGDKLTKWLYINMTTSTDTWNIGNPVILTTNLTGYYENTTATTGTLTTEEVEKLPQNIPVIYTTTQGTITDNTLLINGIATAIYTPVISGENTITANIYTNNTSITKTANKIDTSITMKNINGTTNKNITITAIITSNGNVLNTGTVTFTDTNGLKQTVDINNGIATINTTYTKSGNYTITATYNGNDMYSSSQTTATANIKVNDVNMNITVKPSTTTANTTFNLVIKDIDGNKVTDGVIYFYNNGTLLGNTTVINGTANYNYTFNKAGNYNITAKYNSTTYNSVNKTVNFTITKSDTTLVVNPITGTVQNTITLQANITDQYGNNVTDGKVVFKINGKTIKDTYGNPIYAYVTNGIATLQYVIQYNLAKDNLTIQAIYSGTTDTYNPSRNNNTISVTKRTADINLIITKNPVKAADTVTFMTLLHDSNGTMINNGVVIFKFNGKTIKDNNNNTIKVNVTNGQAKLEYTVPNGISAKTYNITAVYTNNDYTRTETTSPLTTEKIQSIITLNPTTTTRGSNTTLLTGIVKDTNGNLMIGTHKIAVKLGGKSIGTYIVTNGTINTNITIPNILQNTNYQITVKIGDNNGYYGTNATTTLTINSLKTLKQKVSI